MFYRSGILLGFFAVFLQIAVFLQALLPVQYQISPICETISRALSIEQQHTPQHSSHHVSLSDHSQHQLSTSSTTHDGHHHDIHHQCQYCTVYANLVLPPELGVKEVLERIQVRLLLFKRTLAHVYFALQRLFLLPQGRAPPVFA
ncbi:MAG: DUF2946 domain-containing protein [Acinetobacter populi]|uniref:DUF2946 domain-containing protein n=1 Tax=Acinetobacter populi TaxID=1582270 RepID=UPI00235648C8|nr:DUF2946 domain-containing protein [Acinetobacter populi]MCH4247207.1 DUF2946 domain-containing protein [Acinetobacter populi]